MSIYWEWNLGSLEAACPLNHESFQPTPQHTFQMTDVTWLMHRSVGFRSFYLYAVKVMATSFSRKKLLLFEIASEARKGRAGGEAGICPPPPNKRRVPCLTMALRVWVPFAAPAEAPVPVSVSADCPVHLQPPLLRLPGEPHCSGKPLVYLCELGLTLWCCERPSPAPLLPA